MKKLIFALPLSMLIIFTSCKKDKTDEVDSKAVKQSDASGSAEVDEGIDQVNDMINNKIGGGSNVRVAAYNLPCGVVSVDSSTTDNGKKVYKLNYGNMTKCGYKYKSGEISFVLKNGNAFSEAGAIFQTTFTNYKVEVLATGSVVTLNGTLQVTNVNGGFVWQVITNSSTVVTHKLRGSINITYANGEIRNRKYFQLRTFKNTSSGWAGFALEIDGDSLVASDNISETGQTYDGNYDFFTAISQPFTWSNCGTTWAGPYLLKDGNARMNVTVPNITPTYIDVDAGFDWDYANGATSATEVNNCDANAYRITTVIGTKTVTSYQLY